MTAEIKKRDRIKNLVKWKIVEIKTAEIEECLYFENEFLISISWNST